jgi:hypothetical protein
VKRILSKAYITCICDFVLFFVLPPPPSNSDEGPDRRLYCLHESSRQSQPQRARDHSECHRQSQPTLHCRSCLRPVSQPLIRVCPTAYLDASSCIVYNNRRCPLGDRSVLPSYQSRRPALLLGMHTPRSEDDASRRRRY